MKELAAIVLSLAAVYLMLEIGPAASSMTAFVLGLMLCFGGVRLWKAKVRP